MSATLLFVIPGVHVGLAGLRDQLESNFIVSGDAKSLTIGRPGTNDKAFLVPVSDFVAEGMYEDWPDEYISQGPISAFSFDYVSVELMLSIVHALSDRFDAIVDTNFGAVMPSTELNNEHLPGDLA
jgi:hypothetical protein